MTLVLLNKIVTSLSSYGFGTLGTDLFGGQMPNTPYICTGVFITGGFHIPGEPTQKPSIQIAHRSLSFRDGFSRANSIHSLFSDAVNKIGCDYPGRFNSMGYPGLFWKDDNGHYIFPLNYVFVTTKKQ